MIFNCIDTIYYDIVWVRLLAEFCLGIVINLIHILQCGFSEALFI